jgi:hypothetical protein
VLGIDCGLANTASIRWRDRHDFAEGLRGMAGPTEAHETALGVEEIIKAVEELYAGVDERRAGAVNQIEVRRSQRIALVAERERVERLGRILGRNRGAREPDRARHSDGEWITAVLEKRPDLTRAQLKRTRDLMNMHARDALVTDFEPLIDVLELPDPDDRHVLAAAIKGRADLIVTFNLKDFTGDRLDRWEIEAQHPDESTDLSRRAGAVI